MFLQPASVLGAGDTVPHVCENVGGTCLAGVVCNEITALLEVVLIRDIAIAGKKRQNYRV